MAMMKWVQSQNANLKELLNVVIHKVNGNPSTPVAGQIWYDTATGKLKYRDADSNVDPTNRAEHSGTQLASSISDFDTQVRISRLDQMAAPTAAVPMNGQKITGIADGTAGSDAASYGQLLQIANNQSFKAPVRAATTANITNLAGGAPNTLDSTVNLAAQDRVLVKDQTTASGNGIYVVTTVGTGANGTWTRAEDFNTSAEAVPGSIVGVQEGTANGDKMFLLATNGPITLGTTALMFTVYGASTGEIVTAGAGLTKTASTLDVGAGTGISVSADSIAVDTAVVSRKVVMTVPPGNVDAVLNHALANRWVSVTVFETATGDEVQPGKNATDANNFTLSFAEAPTASQYTAVVVG